VLAQNGKIAIEVRSSDEGNGSQGDLREASRDASETSWRLVEGAKW